MIAERDQYTVQSTVQGDKVAMGIRVEDMAHIMGVLTDLYSNKLLAVIREYSTNALDAQIEAGVTRPIEVALPGALSPFLKIRDFGVGLSEQEIREVYSQYGRSTKRESNDVVGMLGLGCKSALTYASQFTVVSVKDGRKVTVAISREADGSGSMTPISNEATDEANGTEVVVPINRQDYYRAEAIAKEFYSVWDEGTVLVNGKPPVRFEGLRIADGLYVVSEGTSRIVMGNVPYPAPALNDLAYNGSILAFVPIGAVNFPPSREALMDTKQTKATIESIRAQYATESANAIQREVEKAATPAEAIRLVVKWSQRLHGSTKAARTYTYKGDALPPTMEGPEVPASDGNGTYNLPFIVSSRKGYREGVASHNVRAIPAGDWPGTVWIEGFTPAKYTALHKRKMNKGADEAGLNGVEQYVCLDGKLDRKDPAMKFIDPSMILDWDVLRKIQLEPRKRAFDGTVRIPGSYDVYVNGEYKSGVPGDKIDQSKPIFFHRGNRWSATRFVEAITEYHPANTVVLLSENRVAKFQRILPAAKSVRDGLDAAAKAWVDGLTQDQRLALTMDDDGCKGVLKALDARKVNDPDLKAAIKVAGLDVTKLSNTRAKYQRVARCQTAVPFENPLDKYPLFSYSVLGDDEQHVYDYLNWQAGR